MLQIVQYQKSGKIFIEELPLPKLKTGSLIVQNICSLISAGTERTSVETAQASIVGKAKSRPDLVKQVIDNIKSEGLVATYEKVQNRLDNYKELGYSSAGIVVESAIEEFKPGDKVACAGDAFHAEFVSISKNLAAKIPDNVSFEEAAFTTLGAIALQGIRQADVKIGDYIAVIGLGLLGLITVQILKANGCKVIGLDISSSNFELAKKLGCNECTSINSEAIRAVEDFSENRGCDSVIITASTSSKDPIEKAIDFSRKKGKVIIVGSVGMNFPRSPAYEKEIEIKLSCSYGPGRYDPEYEDNAIDYPFAYVRWTENRNMCAILNLISEGKLNFNVLITHKFLITDALKAYEIITGKIKEKYIGIIISYHDKDKNPLGVFNKKILNSNAGTKSNSSKVSTELSIGFIGAGNFAQSYILPTLKKLNIKLVGVATNTPVNAKAVSDKFGFEFFTTDPKEIFNDKTVNTVFITTRHDSHGKYVLEALKKNKNVYVEKPLCIDENELIQIISLSNNSKHRLMVGYNRRFSEPIKIIKKFFKDIQEPLYIHYRINAGFIPKTSWIQSLKQNGRIIGEVCHFIDTIQFITKSKPERVYAKEILDKNNRYSSDNINIIIYFSDGSVGNISYLANGSRLMEKEHLEVFGGGKSAEMIDFRKVILYGRDKKIMKKFSGGKGHFDEMKNVVNLFKDSQNPIPFDDLILTTLTTFKIVESIKQGKELNVEI